MSPEHPRHLVLVPQKVLDELTEIRDSGQTNMMSTREVMVIADSLGFHELVCWVDDNPKDYRRGILRGFRVEE